MKYKDFLEGYNNKILKPSVDLNKGHALMKSAFAPTNWRITINLLTWISLLAFPGAILLFFFVKWWIPLAIIFLAFLFIKAIREESAKAVIMTSLKDEAFYNHAILSGTMQVIMTNTQTDTISSLTDTSTARLAIELYRTYLTYKESDPILTDEQIVKNILSKRYPKEHLLHDLSESNKEYISDLQTLAFSILNMEFDGGRDQDSLAEMHFETLDKLATLGHQPSVEERKGLEKIMKKAREKDFDEIEAAKISIKQGFMHKRKDFDIILNGLFED